MAQDQSQQLSDLSDISFADPPTPTHRPHGRHLHPKDLLQVPYQLDLVTGSQTSWPLTLAAFTLMLLVVMESLFNLFFGGDSSLDWQIAFYSKPSSTEVFGAAFSTFSVEITGSSGEVAVVGQRAVVRVIMIDQAHLQSLIREDLYFMRAVDCYDFMTSPEGYYTDQDAVLCRAPVTGEMNITDDYGLVSFTNFTVCSGLPGAYLLMVSMYGPFGFMKSVSAYVTLESSLVGLEATLTGTLPRRLGDVVDVQATLMFSNLVASNNVTPVGAEVAVLPVSIDGRHWLLKDRANRKLLMASLDGPKVTRLANNTVTIQPQHVQVLEDGSRVNVSLTLRGVQLLSGNPTVYLAVHCMGTFAMVPNPTVDSKQGQDPEVLQLALVLLPRVARVDLRRPPSPTSLTEGTAFTVQPIVCVTNDNGDAVSSVLVMAKLTRLAGWDVDVVTLGDMAPTSWKQLTTPLSGLTGTTGCVTFTGLGVDAYGPVGSYAVDFQCEGVGLQSPWAFNVTSSLAQVAVHVNSLPFSEHTWASEEVVVGQLWPSVPSLLLSNSAGNAVRGKEATLRPTSSGIALVSEALPSNAEGWVFFTSVLTAYALQSGAYSFEVLIDNQVVVTFSRTVVLPSNGSEECAFVRVLQTPSCVLVGQPFTSPSHSSRCPTALVIQPVSYKGDPVVAAMNFRMLDAQALARLTNLTSGESLPSSNGLSYTEQPVFSLAGIGFGEALVGPVTLQVSCAADNSASRGDRFRVQVIRRVARVRLTARQSERLVTALVTDANGTPLSGVSVSGRVMQVPFYTELYTSSIMVNSSTTDNQGTATLGVSFSNEVHADYLYGDFVLYAEAEGIPAEASVTFSFSNPVTSLEIVEPLITVDSNDTAALVQVYFFTSLSGVVRVNGPSSAGSSVQIKVECCDPAAFSCDLDDLAQWTAVEIMALPQYFGKPATASWAGLEALVIPWLSSTNRSGNLVHITTDIVGLQSTLLFRFAYAYGGIIMARENVAFFTQDSNSLELVSSPSSQVIPGKVFGSAAVVKVYGPDGSLVPVALVAAGVLDQAYYSAGFAMDGLLGSSSSSSGRVTFNQLSFLPDTDLRQYQLVFYCPGAEPLLATTVEVTNKAYQLQFVQTLPTEAIVGGSALPVKIAAVLSDGTPVPNMEIRCGLSMTSKAKAKLLPHQVLNGFPFRGCYEAAGNCGQLLAVGARGVTDANGETDLSLVVLSGPSVTYQVSCTGKVLTGDAILQAAAQSRSQEVNTNAMEKYGFKEAGQALQQQMTALVVEDKTSLWDLAKNLFREGELKLTSDPISVTNEIGAVEILIQPLLFAKGYVPPITLKPIFTLWPLTLAQQPRVRVLDRQGNPVSHKTVVPVAFPTDVALTLDWSRTQVTDSNGILQFSDLVALSGDTGTHYRIVFFCNGIPSEPSEKFVSLAPQALTKQWDNLRYALLCFFGMLLPVFISNFPGASPWWLLAAVCSVAGTGLFTYFYYLQDLTAEWERTTVWVKASMLYLCSAYVLLCLGVGHLLFKVYYFRRRSRKGHPAISGMAKAEEAYQYVRWLATLRFSAAEYVQHLREYEQDPQKIRHPPPTDLVRHIVPLRYYLTAGLCLSLLSLFAMVVIYYYLWLEERLQRLLSYLPSISDAEAEQQELLQSQLLAWLEERIFAFIEANPSFFWLHNVVDFLSSLHPIKLLAELYAWLSDLHRGLTIAGYLALAFTLCLTALHIFLLWRSSHNNLIRIRKQKVPQSLFELTSFNAAETYPAHQLMHLLVGFVFQYFLFLCIFVVLCTSQLRWLLWRLWGMGLILLIITYTVRRVIVLTLEVIALEHLEMRHPRLYQMWASVNLVFLSVIAATLLVIIRWIKTIVFLSVYFVRLDVQLFPGRLGRLDQPYLSFWSMLFVEHTYHNPLKKVFLGYLLQFRVHWSELHPCLGCMLLVIRRHGDRGIRHLSRWRRKWWLAVTLARNPQLCGHRKHVLPPRLGPGHGPDEGLVTASPSQLAELQELAKAYEWGASFRRKAVYFTMLLLFAATFACWMVVVVRWPKDIDG
eukprot:GGOE01014957.1.p1 GENE.GGOE01014957.1~~GGOE01014957.1.p1  ORF type:complete len:2027 (-),score=588.17 GGOE01014957.1:133-6213(-)